MPVRIKICGIKTQNVVDAAAEYGAAFLGFNFFEPSPRYVTPQQAAALHVPTSVKKVALFVDADDSIIENTLNIFPADILQLHGHETLQRVAAIKEKFKLPIIKALPVATAAGIAAAQNYGMADYLMFDAKPPADAPLPGGNAQTFDWTILNGFTAPQAWFLAGGINLLNMADAIKQSGASLLDIASGAESTRGVKDPALVQALLQRAKKL